MKLQEWQSLIEKMPPDTPVVFYRAGDKSLEPDAYCEGRSVAASAVWEAGRWRPCVLVELGEAF